MSLLLALSLAASAGGDLPAPLGQALDLASAERIRAHVRFLADDLCEGRAPGTRGAEIAALYLATQLRLLGVEGGAADGSYLQPVPLVGVTTDMDATRLELAVADERFPLELLEEATASDETLAEQSEVDADLVFVGYGIAAPEQDWDDYKGHDVAGKALLMLVNDPPSEDPRHFGGKALTYYGRWTYKYEEAARRGAAGAILIHRDDLAGYGWGVVRNSWGRERPYVDDRASGVPHLKLASWIAHERADQVLAAVGRTTADLIEVAASREFAPIELGVRVRADVRSRLRPFETANVLGVLRGATRPGEAVVYTAHYDHLGAHPVGEDEDGIYNGAVDNASGCAAILEVARMYRALQPPPSRSILFAFVTAEEGGLRGSQYYAEHPTFPIENIAAVLNLDGLVVHGDPLEVTPLGHDRSSLAPLVERAAAAFGMRVSGDARPEQGLFYRSDHFSFAKQGVPALNIGTGFAFADQPPEWGRSRYEDYRAHRYHQPGDEYDPSWDFAGTRKLSRFSFALGALVAELDEMPQFLPGDEFAGRRGTEIGR